MRMSLLYIGALYIDHGYIMCNRPNRRTSTPCSPIATPVEWFRFGADGTATEVGPNGVSGRYVIERRGLPGGGTETLLSIGGRNMGQVSFVGDTLLLGMAYVDGPDRYFVRLPGATAPPTP
jgi:hypothetical protein